MAQNKRHVDYVLDVLQGASSAGGSIPAPSGSVDISTNGVHDVTKYAEANVNVPPYGVGEVEIVANGDADVNGKATAHVAVPPYGEGVVEITTNGEHDVSGKATANVAVPGIVPAGTLDIVENGERDVAKYEKVNVQVPTETAPAVTVEPLTATENKVYTAAEGHAYNPVTVNVPTESSGGGESGGGALDPAAVYKATRPADWLQMPECGDDEIYLLMHIADGASGLIAFTCSTSDASAYTVTLGTVTEGQFAALEGQEPQTMSNNRTWDAEIKAADCPGEATADGMKQIIIKITGNGITKWAPSSTAKKPSIDYNDQLRIPVVEMAVKSSVAADIRCSYMNCLRYFRMSSPLSIKVSTTTTGPFLGCSSLIAILELDTTAVLDMGYFFNGCESLVAIPKIETATVTNMASMFGSCSSLTEIPEMDTSAVTTMVNMFNNCRSLKTIPQLNTEALTDARYMFSECHALRSIPALNTSAVTDMSRMFISCYSLVSIPELDTAAVTDVSQTFGSCISLLRVPALKLAKFPSLSATFSGCSSLQSVLLNPDATAIDDLNLIGCSLGHEALVALFESLPTTEGYKLKLYGNPGVSALTEDEEAIATGKGWTIDKTSATSDPPGELPSI